MMYRDNYEQCPRCRIDLVSAGSVRMCSQCSGHWVDGEVLREMAQAMVVPARPVEIELVSTRHPKLPCPSCEQLMETYRLYDVPIDRCPRHGLWFDRTELEAVLYAASGHAIVPASVDVEIDASVSAEIQGLRELLKSQ
jgi:Zn-finger nucleic acid-binding protein